eukprot:4903900-Amphidinium_carterae.2
MQAGANPAPRFCNWNRTRTNNTEQPKPSKVIASASKTWVTLSCHLPHSRSERESTLPGANQLVNHTYQLETLRQQRFSL